MCAMELASMLAGQHYSDRPSCVCPIICAFLRGYNDALPDDLRQRLLLRWASEAVGTRSRDPEEVQRRLAQVTAFARDVVPLARRASLSRALGRSDWLFRTEALGGFIGREVEKAPGLADDVDALLEALCATEKADIRWSRPAAPSVPAAAPQPVPALAR